MKAIEASPQSIATILWGHEFVIPEYQRRYSWDAEDCEKLWDDLSCFFDKELDKTDSEQEKYFLGSIVVYPNEKNGKIWEVIDGQQRLTTLLILIKALSEKLSTDSSLQKMLYKKNPQTWDPEIDKPRLESEVQGQIDKESLHAILTGKFDSLGEKNIFRSNYEQLKNLLDKWWQQKTTGARTEIIKMLQDNVVMLPIECASADDALYLFETINDRGKPLGDADIFKAKIYKAVAEKDRKEFIKRWDMLGKHDEETYKRMFRIYMHVSRAQKNDSGKEINLREYIISHHLKGGLSSNWHDIMETLEKCCWVEYNNTSDNKDTNAEENIYWNILYEYSNIYWHYPLHVFLDKYMERQGEQFVLPSVIHDAYVKLMKNTVRYFFIKTIVHNSANAVKDTAYKVCADIFHKRDYVAQYRKNITELDMKLFNYKLKDFDLGRCKKGIILLNASLNPSQSREDYGNFLLNSKVDIEHILPKKWNDYGEWDAESHKNYIDTFGNLMPLEKKRNIAASNEFFSRKQKEYKNSKVQDARDLANKKPPHWYPEDVEQRQKESVKRLKKFFAEFEE